MSAYILFSRRFIIAVFYFAITFQSVCLADSLLNAPQKVVIDAKRNRLLVSNYNTGDIIAIDSLGAQKEFIKNANFVDGLEIVGDTIFGIGNNRNVRAYNLITKALVMDTLMAPVNPADDYLSSITYDSAGHLFISCPGLNTIYRMRISDGAYWVFAAGDSLNRPNGILLERAKNRIIVIDDSRNTSMIHAISLSDSTVSTLCITQFNSPDGIVRDRFGSYYVGGYYLDGIYKIDSAFSAPPVKFAAGTTMVYPTYDYADHSLLVTYYDSNSWGRISLNVYDFTASAQSGHAPLLVRFNDKCESIIPVTAWAWDFNNDGIIDSREKNPVFTYSQPGTYSIRLDLTVGSSTKTIIKNELLKVFNGQSAIRLNGYQNRAVISAAPVLNLTDNFTVELVIKPATWGNNMNQSTLLDKSAVRLYIAGNILGSVGDSSFGVLLTMQNGTQVKLTGPNNCVKLNLWQHLAVSYSAASGTVKMYVNGTEAPAVFVGASRPAGPLQSNDSTCLVLGNTIALNSGYNGVIDELRIWNEARTSTNIWNFMKTVLTGNEQGLIGYWRMDEGSGTVLYDRSPYRVNGSLGTAAFTEGVDLSSLTGTRENINDLLLPSSSALDQNFPNPFNPSTVIRYTLARQSPVKIFIFNSLGEMISEMDEGTKQAGSHERAFNAGKLASGVYFYSVKAGAFQQTKKMMLIR